MVRLRTIGECAMQVGASHVGPEAERLFATLLVLATERGRRVSRARLIALIWPGADERNGRHCLRQTIYKLRQLGAAVDVAGGYLELPASEVEGGLDGLVTSSEFAADEVPVDAPFDEWLPGYAPAFSPPLQEWVEKQRDYVHGQVRRALVKAIIERRAQNRWPEVDALARRCLAFDPLNEEATLALAESAAMTGSKTTALRILDAYLAELGPRAGDIAMPAEVLRRRIAERLKQPRYVDPSEAYFVGRAETMAAFGTALQSAKGGFGSAHLVWGPPGIGKSRLAEEVAKLAALQGFRMYRANCQSTDAGRPLSVFADAVPALRRLPGAAGVDPKSVKYLKRLSEYDDALADPPEDPYDSAVLFANVRRSIFDLFDAVTSECSLLLVVDDAHWLDAMSWGVLRELMEGARSHRLLVLCTSRAPHATAEPPAEPTRGLLVRRLDPLDGPACDELIAAITGGAARGRPDAKLREWTLTVAEGNPLFVRALIGHWMNGYPEYTLPPSLEALIEERLNRLSPSALRVLQACAVLGRNSTIARLEAILDYRTVALLDAVTELERLGLVLSSADGIQVRHDVLRAHTMRRIGATELRLWHRYVGLELRKAAFADRSHDLLWASVEHLALSGNTAEATGALIAFAEYLTTVGLVDDAATLLLNGAEQLKDFLALPFARDAILQTLRRAWRWQDLQRIASLVLAVLAAEPYSATSAAETRLLLLHARWQEDEEPQPLLAECVRIGLDESINSATRLNAALEGVIIAENCCETIIAHRLFDSVAPLLRLGSTPATVQFRLNIVYDSAFGDQDRIPEHCDQLLAVSRATNDVIALTEALRISAHALRIAGHIDAARAHLGECLALILDRQLARNAIRTYHMVLVLEADRGAFDAAIEAYERMFTLAKGLADPFYLQRVAHCGGLLHAFRGDLEEASRLWNPTLSECLLECSRRQQAWSLAQALYIANHRNETVPEELLQRARITYDITKTFAGQDFLLLQLIIALEKRDLKAEIEDRVEFIRLGGRRERYPLPPYLQAHPAIRWITRPPAL